MSSDETSLEIIFETLRCGNAQKISAIDVATGVEVSISAPLNADENYTRNIVARKLEQKLGREGHNNVNSAKRKKQRRRGLIV